MFKWISKIFKYWKESGDNWQYVCGQILRDRKYQNDCVERSILLSNKMKDAKVAHEQVHGTYKGQAHMWIEKNGVIYDPSQYDDNPRYYVVTKRGTVWI